MADEGEYELLPHEEIQKLRDELDKLKKNPLGTTVQAKDLQTSVIELTKAINSLTTLLTETNDEMTREFQRTSISEHFSQISSQNEQIAQGILAVAQMMQQMNSPSETETSSQSVNSSNNEQSANNSYSPSAQNMDSQQSFQTPNQNPVPNQNMSEMVQPFMGSQGMPPPMYDSKSASSPMPPPSLDLPPAPTKKKGGLMGMFK